MGLTLSLPWLPLEIEQDFAPRFQARSLEREGQHLCGDTWAWSRQGWYPLVSHGCHRPLICEATVDSSPHRTYNRRLIRTQPLTTQIEAHSAEYLRETLQTVQVRKKVWETVPDCTSPWRPATKCSWTGSWVRKRMLMEKLAESTKACVWLAVLLLH